MQSASGIARAGPQVEGERFPVHIDRLRGLVARPDFAAFRREFDDALRTADQATLALLRLAGAEAFESLLREPLPDSELVAWFRVHIEQGRIAVTDAMQTLLAQAERRRSRANARNRHSKVEQQPVVIQMKRVVQLHWFNTAGFQSSDAFRIRTSVFRSHQERQFARALLARFPGFVPLPNYPLDQIADLNRLKSLVGFDAWQYGRACRLDAVLVTPVEGDPIAAFELDSRLHDDQRIRARDRLKDTLLQAAGIPLFRLRADEPQATSVDEWYSLLTDEVLDKIDVGERLRTRDSNGVLVPILR